MSLGPGPCTDKRQRTDEALSTKDQGLYHYTETKTALAIHEILHHGVVHSAPDLLDRVVRRIRIDTIRQ